MIRRRPVIIANEIRLKRSQYAGAFVVVEGRDDRLLCERHLNRDVCRIVVGEGKESVRDVLGILDDDGFQGAVGIVDADFDRIQGGASYGPNIAVTDAHDLETMLIQSPALEAVLVEFGSAEKIVKAPRSVRDLLLEAAVPMGALRLYSHRKQLALDFDNIRYVRFVDLHTLAVDQGELVEEVKAKSRRPDIVTRDLVREMALVVAEGHSRTEICTGPDLIGVLSIGLKRALGNNDTNQASEDHVRRALRLAFDNTCFGQSTMCQMLRFWQAGNTPFRLF